MDKYKQMLIDKGIKPTFQRIKILEYLENKPHHPTVDMIYADLYEDVPTLSKTTVYNTLDVLRRNGLVNVLTITESELRYEYHHQTHHHFLCRICGEIIDIDARCTYEKSMNIQGHKIEEIHGYFKGVCNSCSIYEGDL